MDVLIKEFEHLDGDWRIDWLGRIVPRGEGGPAPLITVHLAKLKSGFVDPLANPSLDQSHQVTKVPVDVGLIALLKIGSVWCKGVQKVPPGELARDQATRHWSDFRLVRLNGAIKLNGSDVPMLPPFRYRVGGAKDPEIAGSWVAAAIASEQDDGPHVLLIPSTVLFQATIASSAAATRRLIQGEIHKMVDVRYGGVAREPDAFRIELFKDFCDQEGPAIANLLADPIATREYRRMRGHLVASSVNHSGPRASDMHICFGLPFSKSAILRFAGKRIAFDGEEFGSRTKAWGFLVTQILSIEVPLVFSRLVIDRKNDNRKAENADNGNQIEARFPGSLEPTSAVTPDQPLTSQESPGAHLDKIALKVAAAFVPIGLDVVKEPKDVQKYHGVRLIPLEGEPFSGLASTADRSGTAGIASADVELVNEPVIAVTLQHLFDALDVLASEGLKFETIVVSKIYHQRPTDKRVVNYFSANGRRVRSWRRMSDENPRTRGFVVAEVYLGGTWRYLIDIEHKRAGELSMLLVHAEDGSKIEARRFGGFMEAVAEHNGWRAEEKYRAYWRFAKIRHTKKRGADALAKLIRKALAWSPC